MDIKFKRFANINLMKIVFLSFIALFFSSCKSEVKQNTIQKMVLSNEQNKIIDLTTTGENEIFLFSYSIDNTYKEGKFWLETYKNGVLTENIDGGGLISLDNNNINLALIINKDEDFKWCIVQSDNKGKTSQNFDPIPLYTNGSSSEALNKAIQIEDGKEIVLYSMLFGNKDGVVVSRGDLQDYITNPDLLKDNDYAYLLKCKFTK